MFLHKILILITYLCLTGTLASTKNVTLTCESKTKATNQVQLLCELPEGIKKEEFLEVEKFAIPSEIPKTSTVELTISRLRMTENIPDKIGKQFKISKFVIRNSQLSVVKRSDFIHMSDVIELDLSNNKIEVISRDTFSNLTKLEILSIHDNEIGILPFNALSTLVSLREFDVQYNKIERLEANTFWNNKAIERIYLNNNQLKSISENFVELKNLILVDLRRNFDFCSCAIMDSSDATKRTNECSRDKFHTDWNAKIKFENCTRIKISEVSENATTINDCIGHLGLAMAKIDSEYQSCTDPNKFKKTINLRVVEDVDRCMVARIEGDVFARNKYGDCVAEKVKKMPKLRELFQNCYAAYNLSSKKVLDDESNCRFCLKMADEKNVRKCEIRFFKSYGDDIVDFQKEVRESFYGSSN